MTERATTEAGPQGLASRLMGSGALTSDWLPAYQAVLRESFVPDVIWPGVGPADGGPVASIDRRSDPEGWFRAVYSDESLTTQWDDGNHTGLDRGNVPTCSNSQPTMVFSMLAALDVQSGAKVLEVGTGTGWNAALLSERLGSENVTSIEFDPENAATARARLDAAGYNPGAIVGDGSQGWAAGAPYDRVLITASLREIPADIVRQTRPGGIIVSPYATEYGGEAVVRLTVQEDGSASGPFVGSSAFMRIRQQRAYRTHVKTYLGGKPWPADGRRTTASLSPEDVADWLPCSPSDSRPRGCSPTRRNSTAAATRSGSGTPGSLPGRRSTSFPVRRSSRSTSPGPGNSGAKSPPPTPGGTTRADRNSSGSDSP